MFVKLAAPCVKWTILCIYSEIGIPAFEIGHPACEVNRSACEIKHPICEIAFVSVLAQWGTGFGGLGSTATMSSTSPTTDSTPDFAPLPAHEPNEAKK